jgi:hypothetical protein
MKVQMIKKISDKIKLYFNTFLMDIGNYISKDVDIYLLTDKNTIVGNFIHDKKFKIIREIFIIPDHRGKGLCKIIMRFIIENIDCSELYMDVYKSNIVALNCYKNYVEIVGEIKPRDFKKIYKYEPNEKVYRYKFKSKF